MQTLLQSEENYYNSKRANTQSFQNFIRILIVAFFAAFITNTPWGSLHAPALAYIGTALLLISMILNIDAFPKAQNALEEVRELTHKLYDENDITCIDEIQSISKKENKRSKLLIACLILSIIICPISYIVEKTCGPKEVTQMAKKQQSAQQPSRNVGGREEKRSWDTPSRPITPTPVKPTGTVPSDTPAPAPIQPTPVPTQPAPAEPVSNPKPSTEK